MAKKLSKAHAHASVSTTTTSNPASSQSSLVNPSLVSLPNSVQATGATTTTTTANTDIARCLTDEEPLPRLIVFDLDYTLWPFWVDTHPVPPLKSAGGSARDAATDKVGDSFAFYADVPRMLYTLAAIGGVRLGVASRTHAPDLARDMLKLLHIPPGGGAEPLASEKGGREKSRRALDFFDAGVEAYPASKTRHFEAIQRRTGLPYSEMLFFDDEARNRDVEQALGVLFCHVRDGMTWDELDKGVRRWRARRLAGAGAGAA